jgi:hypothetical protein
VTDCEFVAVTHLELSSVGLELCDFVITLVLVSLTDIRPVLEPFALDEIVVEDEGDLLAFEEGVYDTEAEFVFEALDDPVWLMDVIPLLDCLGLFVADGV